MISDCQILSLLYKFIFVDIRIPLEWKEFEQIKGKIGNENYCICKLFND